MRVTVLQFAGLGLLAAGFLVAFGVVAGGLFVAGTVATVVGYALEGRN